MLHILWNAILYRPIYNFLLLIISVMPGADVGLAIIVLTIVVKLILWPLTQKAILGQIAMNDLQPEIARIKETTPDKAEQSKKTFALYKEKNINPFSSCLPMLIQLPIILALYFVLRNFSAISVLPYSFVHAPAIFNLKFLGIVNLAQKNIVMAVIAGLLQFVVGKLAQGRQPTPTGEGMQAQFQKSMQMQMLYFVPLITMYATYRFSAAVALYWIVSNIVTIAQELYIRRKTGVTVKVLDVTPTK